MTQLQLPAGMIADTVSPAPGYGPIIALILLVIVVAASIVIITHVIPKPRRSGPEKDGTYESGMRVIGDARRRFNVRFYLVAMLFLLFDVELIFMYPWAVLFTKARAATPDPALMSFLFWEMAIFFAILVVGFAYDWKKGVFRYD
ncbi:MAG: NADH-quinone oxidoreductase subunit A [Phycisphaerae bacterium]|nr:NADH-quinone oxidoreductase subunit A [Phycisphaerae bacterium]